MITVSIKINRPSKVVWDYFTNTNNWQKWYGAGMKVTPSWKQGAKIVWASGGDSPITKFIPGKEIGLFGRWMDTTYKFIPESDSETIVQVIESDPKGGASFNDGGAANRAQREKDLQNLKRFIEEETSVTTN